MIILGQKNELGRVLQRLGRAAGLPTAKPPASPRAFTLDEQAERAPLLARIVREGRCSDIAKLSDLNAEGLRGFIASSGRARGAVPKWEDLTNRERAELCATDLQAFKACVADYDKRTGANLGSL